MHVEFKVRFCTLMYKYTENFRFTCGTPHFSVWGPKLVVSNDRTTHL